MHRMKLLIAFAAILPLAAVLHTQRATAGGAVPQAKSDTVLKADDVGPKLFPDR
jgi:hypothetical protein